MVCRNLALVLAVVLQIVSQVVASSVSYVSNNYGEAATVSELISQAKQDEPLVIFRFTNYPLLAEWKLHEGQAPYLNSFFETDEVNSNKEDFPIDELSTDAQNEVFNLGDFTLSASELLYDYHLNGKSVIVFNFDESNYDLASVDEFMESAYLLLSDSYDSIENVVLNVVRTSADSHYLTASNRNTERTQTQQKEEEPSDDDGDVLSTIWTEGLIMCLIVSLLLLAVLVIAISWMSSVDISYGALEKSTNPLKKTK